MKGYFVNDWTRGYRCDYGLSKIGRPWSGETLSRLLAEAERIDQLAVGVEVRALEVVKELAAARNHAKQAAAAVVILGVHLEVLGKVVDAGREKSDPVSPSARWNLATISDLVSSDMDIPVKDERTCGHERCDSSRESGHFRHRASDVQAQQSLFFYSLDI